MTLSTLFNSSFQTVTLVNCPSSLSPTPYVLFAQMKPSSLKSATTEQLPQVRKPPQMGSWTKIRPLACRARACASSASMLCLFQWRCDQLNPNKCTRASTGAHSKASIMPAWAGLQKGVSTWNSRQHDLH